MEKEINYKKVIIHILNNIKEEEILRKIYEITIYLYIYK